MRSAYIAVDIRGETLLHDPLTNKSTVCTTAERAKLGLDGLLPPAVSTMDQQLARVHETIASNKRRSRMQTDRVKTPRAKLSLGVFCGGAPTFDVRRTCRMRSA